MFIVLFPSSVKNTSWNLATPSTCPFSFPSPPPPPLAPLNNNKIHHPHSNNLWARSPSLHLSPIQFPPHFPTPQASPAEEDTGSSTTPPSFPYIIRGYDWYSHPSIYLSSQIQYIPTLRNTAPGQLQDWDSNVRSAIRSATVAGATGKERGTGVTAIWCSLTSRKSPSKANMLVNKPWASMCDTSTPLPDPASKPAL